jgi:hypothetical protein
MREGPKLQNKTSLALPIRNRTDKIRPFPLPEVVGHVLRTTVMNFGHFRHGLYIVPIMHCDINAQVKVWYL